jgi:glutamate-1-semialdehyde 2,1-aminomutase
MLATQFQHSQQLLARAEKSIPLGSQTFSKSKTQYPYGVSPYFIKRGQGAIVWDVDDNHYLDFVNSLGAINLGYNDPDVMTAVKQQLEEGTIFSLPHPIEVEVAEALIELIPCAEMVRFGKNGSDATAGAVRLARAYTQKDYVAVCGYHGWQDWYIGSTTRHLGVPQSTRDLTLTFQYNQLTSLHALFRDYPDQIACIILEPMNVAYPEADFLHEVTALAHAHGALIIFDETITGFRFANGGAQALFGVTPDLATFGKGMANGYPISAITGRADIMRLMEDIFFSFTFGGETLSLAATLAVCQKIQSQPVITTLLAQGQKLIDGLNNLIKRYELTSVLSVSGHPSWSFLLIKDTPEYTTWAIKTLFLQEMFANHILILGSHMMSYAHTDAHITQLLTAYDQVLLTLKTALTDKTLMSLLKTQPLEPLFKPR